MRNDQGAKKSERLALFIPHLMFSVKVHYIVLISLKIMLSWYIETFLTKRGHLKLFFLAFKARI